MPILYRCARSPYFSSLSARRTWGLSAKTGRTLWSVGRGAFNPAISDGIRLYITGYGSEYAFATPKQRARDRAAQRAAAAKKPKKR